VTPARANRTAVALLGGVVAAGVALRFSTLDLQSFWIDEGSTVHLLRRDFGGLLDGISVTEKTPPLYYVLAWLWTRPFGTGEIGVRSLSAIFGVLTIPVAFALARELASERAALVTAALVAFNPLLVWYSQEARAYALLVLLAALATLHCVRAVRRPHERRDIVWWAIASALAIATHYFAAFVVVPLAAWLLARHPQRRAALAGAAVIAATGLALLPLAADQSGNPGSNFITGTSLGTRALQLPKQFLLGYDAPLETAFTTAVLILAAAGGWLALTRARDTARVSAALLAVAVLLPLAAAVAGADFVISRNLIVAVIPLVIVIAAGFAAAGRAGDALAAALAALSLAAVLAVFTHPEFQRDNWRGAAEAIGPANGERALVVNPIAGAVPLTLYLPGLTPFGERFRRVDEIDLVAVTSRRPGETPHPPRPPTPSVPGFRLVARKETDTFTLVRLRAAGPQQIASQGLTPLRLGQDLAVTLHQRPSR
jgi:mannosyltransferase